MFYSSFSDIDRKVEVEKLLTDIKQGNRSVSTLVAEFQRLAVESKWPETVLFQLFYRALNSNLKDEICRYDRPPSIEEYYKMAVRLDNRLTERKMEKKEDNSRLTFKPVNKSNPDAMVIGNSRTHPTTLEEISDSGSHQSRKSLFVEERQYRRENNLCAYCGATDHARDACPKRSRSKGAKNFQGCR